MHMLTLRHSLHSLLRTPFTWMHARSGGEKTPKTVPSNDSERWWVGHQQSCTIYLTAPELLLPVNWAWVYEGSFPLPQRAKRPSSAVRCETTMGTVLHKCCSNPHSSQPASLTELWHTCISFHCHALHHNQPSASTWWSPGTTITFPSNTLRRAFEEVLSRDSTFPKR